MKAIIQSGIGDIDTMYIADIDSPVLQNEEVLVQVVAFGVNRADILQRKGKYPSPAGASPLMGLEIAGTVAQAPSSSIWKVGDRVFGLIAGGGYASYVAIDEQMLWQIPANMSFEEAAAIPEAFLTAYLALVWQGQLQANQRVLLHAASGGVGTAAVQLAKSLKAEVLVTASAHKHQVCSNLGADTCIDYRAGAWIETVGKNSIHVLVDFLGASYFNDNITALATDGRMVMLALMGGSEVSGVDLRKVIGKRITIVGSTLRNRPLVFHRKLAKEFAAYALPLFATGELHPVIDTVMEWNDIGLAHQRMEASEHIGKIVMKVSWKV
ncbi:MAG: NAD(P)H-quinone oxidoreductase [Paludibacteraceae bacterium]|nr:NAD(P)H-quinone oxidoreductase [Paludibacteraceae bacterium]MBP6284664.1 NAD(P)H-quinone oxidoreductase [Paludibacteraceae bacterium]